MLSLLSSPSVTDLSTHISIYFHSCSINPNILIKFTQKKRRRKKMSRSCGCRVLLLTFLLLLSDGFGRKLVENAVNSSEQVKLKGKSMEVIELDYEGPGPNVNGRSAFLDPPPPRGFGY